MAAEKKWRSLLLLGSAAGLFLGRMAYFENYRLEKTEVDIRSRYLPSGMDGLCIVQVSDLHNASFGKDNRKLLRLIAEAEPDLIAVTGDLVDSRRTDVRTALNFMRDSLRIAPVYYVPGNHEARLEEYDFLDLQLRRMGVEVLHNNYVYFRRGGSRIKIIGFDDHRFQIHTDEYEETCAIVNLKLKNNADSGKDYEIALIHRPEFFPLFVRYGIDLVFSGHVHGGQIRLPFFGGLAAPGQHSSRRYISGMYCEGRTTMLQSRGLGNSLFPVRVNNHPEIIVAHLFSFPDICQRKSR